jgi:hypothetical protein
MRPLAPGNWGPQHDPPGPSCGVTSCKRRWNLQPAGRRGHDRRCPSGSGWGEALAPGHGASRDLDEREMPAAKAAWPLARETSVGGRVVLSPGAARFRGAACLTWQRARRTSPVTEHPCASGAGVDVDRWGPNPTGDRRKPDGAGEWSGPEPLGAWGSVGSVVVLTGCLGCRSRRAAFGPDQLTAT